jgi:hypothetical protein
VLPCPRPAPARTPPVLPAASPVLPAAHARRPCCRPRAPPVLPPTRAPTPAGAARRARRCRTPPPRRPCCPPPPHPRRRTGSAHVREAALELLLVPQLLQPRPVCVGGGRVGDGKLAAADGAHLSDPAEACALQSDRVNEETYSLSRARPAGKLACCEKPTYVQVARDAQGVSRRERLEIGTDG